MDQIKTGVQMHLPKVNLGVLMDLIKEMVQTNQTGVLMLPQIKVRIGEDLTKDNLGRIMRPQTKQASHGVLGVQIRTKHRDGILQVLKIKDLIGILVQILLIARIKDQIGVLTKDQIGDLLDLSKDLIGELMGQIKTGMDPTKIGIQIRVQGHLIGVLMILVLDLQSHRTGIKVPHLILVLVKINRQTLDGTVGVPIKVTIHGIRAQISKVVVRHQIKVIWDQI